MNKKNLSISLVIMGVLAVLVGVFIEFNLKELNDYDEVKEKKIDFSKKLEEAYNKISLSTMNGYKVAYTLMGPYKEEKYLDIVTIENYMNKKYRVTVEYKNDKWENIAKSDVYYIIGDITYAEKENKEYRKLDEEIIYNDTEVYLKGLINAKEVSYESGKSIEVDGNTYEKYKFLVNVNIIKEILEHTNIKHISFDEESIECVAWLDEEGYLYRLDYNLLGSIDGGTPPLTLFLFLMDYNEIEDFNIAN